VENKLDIIKKKCVFGKYIKRVKLLFHNKKGLLYRSQIFFLDKITGNFSLSFLYNFLSSVQELTVFQVDWLVFELEKC